MDWKITRWQMDRWINSKNGWFHLTPLHNNAINRTQIILSNVLIARKGTAQRQTSLHATRPTQKLSEVHQTHQRHTGQVYALRLDPVALIRLAGVWEMQKMILANQSTMQNRANLLSRRFDSLQYHRSFLLPLLGLIAATVLENLQGTGVSGWLPLLDQPTQDWFSPRQRQLGSVARWGKQWMRCLLVPMLYCTAPPSCPSVSWLCWNWWMAPILNAVHWTCW